MEQNQGVFCVLWLAEQATASWPSCTRGITLQKFPMVVTWHGVAALPNHSTELRAGKHGSLLPFWGMINWCWSTACAWATWAVSNSEVELGFQVEVMQFLQCSCAMTWPTFESLHYPVGIWYQWIPWCCLLWCTQLHSQAGEVPTLWLPRICLTPSPVAWDKANPASATHLWSGENRMLLVLKSNMKINTAMLEGKQLVKAQWAQTSLT